MRSRAFGLLWTLSLVIVACGGGGGGGDVGSPEEVSEGHEGLELDVIGGDDTAISDGEEEESGKSPTATTLLKGPYLQWPTDGGFYAMAESADPVPLRFDVAIGGVVVGSFWSEPVKPLSSVFEGAPLLDGFLHEAKIEGLSPGQDFVVRVANTGDEAQARMPKKGGAIRIVAFGDNRTQDNEHQMVVQAIESVKPDVVLNTGDMVAFGGDKGLWGNFFRIEASLLSASFYFAAMGNHEGPLGQDYFDALFHTENTFENEGNYYVVIGDVGLVTINQYGPTDWSDPEALAWLEGALSFVRSNARWLIVMFHEPMYTFSEHGPWIEGREVVQPLIEKYGADLVLSGHNHCYEHFRVNGIDYVVTGGGGAPLYDIGEGPPEEQGLLVAAKKFYHFVQLDVAGESAKVKVIDATTKEVFEEFAL